MTTVEAIETKLQASFPDSEIVVQDLTGTQDHFQAMIISPLFEGKTMVQQHQMVYQALGNAMESDIHALALKTYTPQQWKALV